MIHFYENFFTSTQCQHFITGHADLFKPHFDNRTFYFRKTEVVELSQYADAPKTKKLNGHLNFTVKQLDEKAFVNYFQIVKWPVGEFQGPHKDMEYHCYSSIIYLNDNFKGGETIIDGTVIKPKSGLMVLFDGNNLMHSVNKIEKGIRYTMPCWYTK